MKNKIESLFGDLFYPFQIGWYLELYELCNDKYYDWCRVVQHSENNSEIHHKALKQRNRYEQLSEYLKYRILSHHDRYMEYFENRYNYEVDPETDKLIINDSSKVIIKDQENG